eukprot:m51a1_g311 hypothetical protein (724) ;mRNA; f:411458-414019
MQHSDRKSPAASGPGGVRLRVAVPSACAAAVALVVLISVAPMSALWFLSLRTLGETTTATVQSQSAAYRACIVARARSDLLSRMAAPFQLLRFMSDVFDFALFAGTAARAAPELHRQAMGWVNGAGKHHYSERWGHFTMYDCPNATPAAKCPLQTFAYSSAHPGDPSRAELSSTAPWTYTTTNWYSTGLSTQVNFSEPVWAIQMSVDGLSMNVAVRAAPEGDARLAAANATIVQAMLIFNSTFFTDVLAQTKLTEHAWAVLVSSRMHIVSATPGVVVKDAAGTTVYALASPNASVAAAVRRWAQLCGRVGDVATTEGLRDASFDLGDADEHLVEVSNVTRGLVTLWVVLGVPRRDFLGDVDRKNADAQARTRATVAAVVGCEAAFLLACVAASTAAGCAFVRPLTKIVKRMQRVSRMSLLDLGDLGVSSCFQELRMLEAETNTMSGAIGSFGKYVPTTVVAYLLRNRIEAVVGMRKMTATVLFLDIANFTRTMEEQGIAVVLPVLERMFEEFSNIITRNRGVIDKYIGDAIMALWGCPEAVPQPERLACTAVVEMREALAAMNETFASVYGVQMAIRIGLHSGELYAGNVGCSTRLNYTVLGNSVNLASRLEPLNKEFGTLCLATDAVRGHNEDAMAFRCLGPVAVKGFAQCIRVHEFVGEQRALQDRERERLQAYLAVDRALVQECVPKEAVALLRQYVQTHCGDTTARCVLCNVELDNRAL